MIVDPDGVITEAIDADLAGDPAPSAGSGEPSDELAMNKGDDQDFIDQEGTL